MFLSPCDPVTFDLILIGGRGLAMDFSVSAVFGFIVWTDRQNHTQMPLNALLLRLTESHTDAAKCLTPATDISVSNYYSM